MTAWLLLLLERGGNHGYGLCRQLHARGLSAEPGAAYRALRALEDQGAVTSHWTASVGGPQRRQYRITAEGRRRLGDAASQITVDRDARATFLQVLAEVHQRPEPGEAPLS